MRDQANRIEYRDASKSVLFSVSIIAKWISKIKFLNKIDWIKKKVEEEEKERRNERLYNFKF